MIVDFKILEKYIGGEKMKPLLKNIGKANYNNILEKVLENKDFTANTKSLLLSMLYKLEVAYDDYKTVKVFVKTKEELLQDIIETIDKKCVIIKLVEPSSETGMQMIKNHEQAFIENQVALVCFPTEKSLLVGITLLMDNKFYVKAIYRMINFVISDFLNLSYGVNIQECIYNFDGWSWNNQFELEYQFLYSILYYNLLNIVDLEFIEEWRKSQNSDDYIEKLKKILTRKYGERNAKRLFLLAYRVFMKILISGYKEETLEILEEGRKIKEAIDYMDNKSKYMQDIYDKKKDINTRIKEIEQMMLDKNTLKQKYHELNETLPLDKQIFSVRRFSAMIKQERENLYNEIKNYNQKLDPKTYLKEKQELEEKYLKFSDLHKIKKSKSTLEDEIINIQNKFLELKEFEIGRIESKKEILNNIYVLRYYKNMKLNKNTYIKEEKYIKKSLKNYERKLLSKAYQNNMLIVFTKNILQNIEIVSEILDTKIINLKDIEVLLRGENNRIIMDIYDGEILDVSLKLSENIREIAIKPNKKIKLLL